MHDAIAAIRDIPNDALPEHYILGAKTALYEANACLGCIQIVDDNAERREQQAEEE